jgi:hypothetical protein
MSQQSTQLQHNKFLSQMNRQCQTQQRSKKGDRQNDYKSCANLSFNLNAADPNNEYESVPAYIRRNMELASNASTVENFYSNYQVKDDGKGNGATISTINTFLDGKKPD